MRNWVSALALVALWMISLIIGARVLSPSDVLSAISGSGPADIRHIVVGMRVPRGLLAALVGASLAVAGLLAQSWTRNPLADPGIIGITAGARFAVTVAALFGVSGLLWQSSFALVGALLATLLILAVARMGTDPLTLILVGVGINATLIAVTTLLGMQSQAVFNDMRQWSVGTTVGRGYPSVVLALVGCAIALALAFVVARRLDILAMGADTAASLGISVPMTICLVVTALVVSAGTATVAAGPVVFVGLAAPHMVRSFAGVQVQDRLLPCAFMGAHLALCADIIGRIIARPGEVEFSVVLALIGAPLMIWLIRKGARA